jgi:hypothetical protein
VPNDTDAEQQECSTNISKKTGGAVLKFTSFKPILAEAQGGVVSLYNRNYYVGKIQGGKTIYVMLDPLRKEWVLATNEAINFGHSRPGKSATTHHELDCDQSSVNWSAAKLSVRIKRQNLMSRDRRLRPQAPIDTTLLIG